MQGVSKKAGSCVIHAPRRKRIQNRFNKAKENAGLKQDNEKTKMKIESLQQQIDELKKLVLGK